MSFTFLKSQYLPKLKVSPLPAVLLELKYIHICFSDSLKYRGKRLNKFLTFHSKVNMRVKKENKSI